MIELRSEVVDAHHALVDHWSSPGAHWSPAERVEMVSQVRAAFNAAPIEPPWRPASEAGATSDVLPTAVVDALWRITQHPGTLSKEWHDQVLGSGVDAVAFVELASIAAMASLVETFTFAVGAPSPELPSSSSQSDVDKTADQPVLPSSAVDSHWVPTTDFAGPNIRKALSAIPSELQMQGALLDAHYVPGGAMARDLGEFVWSLERTQMELVATRTSTMNECFY